MSVPKHELEIVIPYLDIPDIERDSIDSIVALAKQTPKYVRDCDLLQDDPNIYVSLVFCYDAVTVIFT